MDNNRKHIRLKYFDYGNTGSYYVTICTHDRKPFLSNINTNKVELTTYGKIVEEELHKTIEMRKYLCLDYYVIMPNHIHLILLFQDRAAERLEENGDTPVREFGGSHQHSLSSVIANFKAAVTTRIRKMVEKKDAVIWQKSFYEHIIRDEKDLMRIRDYIVTNPLNWHLDHENPNNILPNP